MKWFEEFIEETRELWQKQKEDTISKIMEDIDLLLEELTSKEKGDIGEEHVEELLANREFYTVITKRSQTPSDVTGLRVSKNYVHIMLVQVKTAKVQKQPRVLSNQNICILRIFTKFVLDRFKESTTVPEEYKTKVLLISNGYVGIKIQDGEQTVMNSNAFTFWWPTKLDKFKDLAKELVATSYDL